MSTPSSTIRTVLVVSGGKPVAGSELLSPGVASVLGEPELVIAADSGVDRAIAAGLKVDIAIGDFDSVTALSLARAEAEGAQVIRHRPDKNETDLELAILKALEFEPEAVMVVAMDGGRLDHFLAGVLLLADERFAQTEMSAMIESSLVTVVRGKRTLAGRVNDTVTLLPLHGPASGVTTHGLHYPLADATLEPGTTWGVSNIMRAPLAVVSVDKGVVLAIQPQGSADQAGEAI